MAFWIIITPLLVLCAVADAYERRLDWHFWAFAVGAGIALILRIEWLASVLIVLVFADWAVWRIRDHVKREVHKEITAQAQLRR